MENTNSGKNTNSGRRHKHKIDHRKRAPAFSAHLIIFALLIPIESLLSL
jgi:hypothetical protein